MANICSNTRITGIIYRYESPSGKYYVGLTIDEKPLLNALVVETRPLEVLYGNIKNKNMSNICSNTFYACSEDRQNIDTIINFFHDWPYAEIEDSDTSVDVCFDSKWVFPEKEMNELYDLIPNKDDLYARCLSVEYGMDYVAYWKCNEEGWYQEV